MSVAKSETHERAFITKNSTSPTGTFVSSAIVWNDKTLSSEARLKTLSMRAIKQIF
jgi:hypothetical protein